MLLLSSDSLTVNGVTVFPDHVDPNQFWYLPAPVGLATMADTGEPQFLLIEYAPDVASSGVNGVGFLNVTMCLKIDDDTKNTILGQVGSAFPTADTPRLAPAPFDEGTVQIVTLNMQGSGGTAAPPAPPGSIQMVENILGAVSPELYGDNNALFALSLSEDAATILKAAFEDGMAPVGGIYNLKFTGVRPALDVKVTADLKRVYDSFSVALTAKAYWVSAGIDATFEKLRQDGAITIEVVNLAGDQANADAEKAALDFFKQDILTNWFTPSLSPTTAAAADAAGHGTPATSTSTTTTGAAHPVSPPPPPPARSGSMQAGGAQAGGMKGGAQHPAPAQGTGGQASPPASPPAPGQTTPAPPAQGAGGSPPAPPSPPAPGQATAAPPATPPATAPPSSTTTTTQPAGGTAGQVVQAAQGIAQAAQSAGSAASPFGVSLQLKFVHQEEQKTVTYEYNRMDAVQRTYAPQGYFGLLLQGIDQSKHFLEVNGTDPFFSKFSVVLSPPHDFATIGLQSVHVALDYGDPGTDGAKHGEFVFDTNNSAQTTWDVFEGQVHQTDFAYTSTYNFDPESGWVGASDSYTLPTATTENRQLTLDPHDTLGFLAVNIMPGRIDPNLVDRVEASLTYADDRGWSTSADFVVRTGANAQVWKLRLSDKAQRTFNYTTNCVLKDGTAFPAGPFTSTASAIFVNDAFGGGGIDVMIQPAFDPAYAKSAFIELNYADAADAYRFSTTQFLQAVAGSAQPTRIHIPVIDAAQRQFDYTITIITADDQQLHGATVTTAEPLIVVGNTP